MYCKHCGREIDDNSEFCKYCGKQLVDKKKIIVEFTKPKSIENSQTYLTDDFHRWLWLSYK